MPTASTEKGRDINDTLSALGIDAKADPEEVARDAAEEVASSVDVETDGKPSNGRRGKGGAAEVASSAEVEVVVPSPAPEDEGIVPIPGPSAPMVPPPKPARARKPQGAGKGMPKNLLDKAPGAARVKVYKRDKGNRGYISDYSAEDLNNFSDFESFLTRYVMDDYGPGEYDLVGVDAANREMELGTVRLLGVPQKKDATGALDLVSAMMERNEKQNERYLQQMREVTKPRETTDPLEMLAGLMQVQEKLSGNAEVKAAEAKEQINEAQAALAASGDRTMQMMMMMMQENKAQADRQNQMMMALLSKPKEEDPVMKMLLMKLTEDGSIGAAAPPPPPPAPPPQQSPTEGLTELVKAMGMLMTMMGGGGEAPDDEFKEFLKAKLLQQDNNSLSVKDVLELVTKKEDRSSTLKSTIDDLAAVMNVAQNFSRSQEGGVSAGFFDALGALFSNRDFAGSIANTIRARIGQGEAQQRTAMEAERQRLALQQRMLQRTQQMAAPQMTPGAPMAPQQMYPVPQTPPQAVQQPQSPQGAQRPMPPQAAQQPPPQTPQRPVPPQGVVGPYGAVGPSAEQVQQAAAAVVQRTGKVPELPTLTQDHVQALDNAADEGELVGRTVAMLIHFAEFEDWRPFSEQFLGYVRDGNKRASLQYLKAFFGGLAELHVIDPGLAERAVDALMRHFDAVRDQLTEIELDGDGEVTGDDLMAPPDDGDLTEIDDEPTPNDVEPGGDGEPA